MRPAVSARRVTAAVAAPATLASVVFAVMVVNTFARGMPWQREWFWAAYQYHFGLILCGPVAAGLGAWRGRVAGRGRWLTASAANPGAPRWTLATALAGVVAGYAVGALPVMVAVLVSGSPDRPPIHVATSFLPALAALSAYLAVGVAIGARWPVRVIAPLVAIGAFATTMLGWIAGWEAVVRLGGATMSLAGLRPSPSVQVWQTVFYAATAAGASAWFVGRMAGARHERALRAIWAATALGAGAWLVWGAGPVVLPTTPRTSCLTLDSQRYCAPIPYGHELERVARRLTVPIARLRSAGVDVPPTVELGRTVGLFDGRLTPSNVHSELFALVDVGRCLEDGIAHDEIVDVSRWLALVAGDASQTEGFEDADVPAALRSGDPATEDRWGADALRRIRSACP